MPQYYPIFMDLKDQSILVVGGGNVALRKVQTLLKHGAVVRVVSPEIVPELRSLINDTTCCWFEKDIPRKTLAKPASFFPALKMKKSIGKCHLMPRVNIVQLMSWTIPKNAAL